MHILEFFGTQSGANGYLFTGADGVRMTINSSGNVGIGNPTITARLHVSASTGYNQFRLQTSYTPTSTADGNGNTGDVAWDADYIYIKTAAGWKRSALTTW